MNIKLGVLTSGGDCAGLNAAIAAVARGAARHGWQLLGIADGTLGLFAQPPRAVSLSGDGAQVADVRAGGSFLGTVSSGDPLHFEMPDGSRRDRSQEFADGVRQLGLDALIVIGGDGSMRILTQLCAAAGLPMVGVPKTIDNDVPGTDLTIGFATAVQCVADALDRLRSTAASHHRAMVVEVMGRESGHLALHGGIAGGADVIVLPELGLDVDAVVRRVRDAACSGRGHSLVVVAEGARPQSALHDGGFGGWLAARIEAAIGVPARSVVLGHLQRGGSPCAQDRVLAADLGLHAVALLAAGSHGRMAAWRNGSVADLPLAQVICGPRRVDAQDPLLRVARQLGIELGGAS